MPFMYFNLSSYKHIALRMLNIKCSCSGWFLNGNVSHDDMSFSICCLRLSFSFLASKHLYICALLFVTSSSPQLVVVYAILAAVIHNIHRKLLGGPLIKILRNLLLFTLYNSSNSGYNLSISLSLCKFKLRNFNA